MITARPSKKSALRFAEKMVPLYAELFDELKTDGGRVNLHSRISIIRQNVATYVTLYDDERRLAIALLKGLITEEGFEEFAQETAQLSDEEKEPFLANLLDSGELDELFSLVEIPTTEEGWKEADKAFLALPADEQAIRTRQASLFWAGIFGNLFNMLSLMVHGAKLTTLVPQAIAGDDEAFLKTVQIDRCLISHHPYFLERKRRAQDEGEIAFLRALGYREANPTLKGKIRYPALYMLFGILESVQWLGDLRHEELLDLCESAGLDRFQNRIEDVNYVTKRLLEYQRWKKSGGLSMY